VLADVKEFVMAKEILMLVLFFCVGACNVYSQSGNGSSADIRALCSRLAEIKTLPIKGEPGIDAAYDSLVGAGDAVVPCLIQKITNLTPIRDPRCLFSERTTVGDIAYFVLVHITKLDFAELLPAEVQKEIQTNGVYAFHDYIRRKGARSQLQFKVREWYRRKHPA
jgi:hypothetical protein